LKIKEKKLSETKFKNKIIKGLGDFFIEKIESHETAIGIPDLYFVEKELRDYGYWPE